MQLTYLHIHNFKSIRDMEIRCTGWRSIPRC